MYNWIGKVTDEQNLRRFSRIFGWIPRPICLIFFYACSRITYLLASSLRQHIYQNMKELLPDRSHEEFRSYLISYFDSLFISLYEILIDSFCLERTKEWRFQVEGEQYLEEVLKKGNGAILVSPHIGNFFYYYWYLSQKYHCMTVVTAGSKELRPLYLLFQQMGCQGLDYDDTPPLLMMRTLREHLKQNGVVFLLSDFFRPNFPKAIFFQRETRSPSGAAVLALEQQVPIIPYLGYRESGFKHRLVFGAPIYLYEEMQRKQRAEAINRINQLIEHMVKKVPGQWFYWFNVEERWDEKPSKVS